MQDSSGPVIMDWSLIIGFVTLSTVLTVSPGANFALIVNSASAGGFSAALANIPGFSAAFLLQGTLSILGLAAALAASPSLLYAIQLVGALYLFYLGVQAFIPQHACELMATATMTARVRIAGAAHHRRLIERGLAHASMKGFKEGFVTNCLNPKTMLFYYAVFPQLTAGVDDPLQTSFFLVLIHIAINALWFSLVAMTLCHLLRSSGSQMIVWVLRKGSGVALIGFSAYFFVGVALSV